MKEAFRKSLHIIFFSFPSSQKPLTLPRADIDQSKFLPNTIILDNYLCIEYRSRIARGAKLSGIQKQTEFVYIRKYTTLKNPLLFSHNKKTLLIRSMYKFYPSRPYIFISGCLPSPISFYAPLSIFTRSPHLL